MASCIITGHLVAALRSQVEFRTADQSTCPREGHTAVRKRNENRAEEALTATITGTPVQGIRRLRRVTMTGDWLRLQPSTVNGTDMGVQKWRDSLFLRYGLDPPDLPNYCDRCNTKFSICHALYCKRGSLVPARHNELLGGVADLAGKVFTPSHV